MDKTEEHLDKDGKGNENGVKLVGFEKIVAAGEVLNILQSYELILAGKRKSDEAANYKEMLQMATKKLKEGIKEI